MSNEVPGLRAGISSYTKDISSVDFRCLLRYFASYFAKKATGAKLRMTAT